jgi:ketosteroid isomerase-like protein
LVFLNWTGTQKGEFQGKMPTDKPITMRTAHLFRIEDGEIAENREISDTLDLLRQIGATTFNYTRD